MSQPLQNSVLERINNNYTGLMSIIIDLNYRMIRQEILLNEIRDSLKKNERSENTENLQQILIQDEIFNPITVLQELESKMIEEKTLSDQITKPKETENHNFYDEKIGKK